MNGSRGQRPAVSTALRSDLEGRVAQAPRSARSVRNGSDKEERSDNGPEAPCQGERVPSRVPIVLKEIDGCRQPGGFEPTDSEQPGFI